MRPMKASEREDIKAVIDEITRLKRDFLGLARICGSSRASIEFSPLILAQVKALRRYLELGRIHGIDVLGGIRETGFPQIFAHRNKPSHLYSPYAKYRTQRIVGLIRDWSQIGV